MFGTLKPLVFAVRALPTRSYHVFHDGHLVLIGVPEHRLFGRQWQRRHSECIAYPTRDHCQRSSFPPLMVMARPDSGVSPTHKCGLVNAGLYR